MVPDIENHDESDCKIKKNLGEKNTFRRYSRLGLQTHEQNYTKNIAEFELKEVSPFAMLLSRLQSRARTIEKPASLVFKPTSDSFPLNGR